MKNFLNTINWKTFALEMLGVFAFFGLSYWAGNNKFPHNVWIVPFATIVIGFMVLLQVYYNFAIKKEKEQRNGTNNG
jgi:hypothetical protein